jgi:hypothetical protein
MSSPETALDIVNSEFFSVHRRQKKAGKVMVALSERHSAEMPQRERARLDECTSAFRTLEAMTKGELVKIRHIALPKKSEAK